MMALTFNSFSQEVQMTPAEPTYLMVSKEVMPLLREFIAEGEKRGVYVTDKINDMKYIGFNVTIQYPVLGYCSKDFKHIYLNENIQMSYFIFRYTVFHELGHAVLGKKHYEFDTFEIMGGASPYAYGIYENEVYWQKRLDVLFSKF